MSNIINNKKVLIDVKLCNYDTWDMCLCKELYSRPYIKNGLQEDCLISYIDINNSNCVWFDKLYSLPNYIWSDSINNGVINNFIGYTGVDNGFITYKKDRINNLEFYNIYTNSTLNLSSEDKRLHLTKVNGNNMLYDYTNNITEKDGILCSKLNGGFYQGFFQLFGEEYKVLPSNIYNTTVEITLMPSNFNEKHGLRLNDIYPNNQGIFLYIGTRAENKWCLLYNNNEEFEKSNNHYVNDEYVNNDYTKTDNLNENYLKPYKISYVNDNSIDDEYTKQDETPYILDKSIKDEYIKPQCNICNMYVDEEYIKDDKVINENEKQFTSEGYCFDNFNIAEIPTDNKFIFFNNTKDGFNIKTWDDNIKYILTSPKYNNNKNYFLYFNKTKEGLDINNIQELNDLQKVEYDILSDLYYNAIAFQIKQDGSIGYKYLIKDCAIKQKYNIMCEYSSANTISYDKWSTIDISIKQISEQTMILYIFVNGKLALLSKELPLLRIRELNDLKDKQVGVPYNISLGGGTQGLCDVIYMNYRKLPLYKFPLEKEFAGTFIGYIKDFKLYNCVLDINQINENVNFEKVSFSK